MNPLLISGEELKVDDVVEVTRGRPVQLDPAAIPKISRSRQAVERLVNEGVTVLQEIEDLQAGLKETVKAVAEELDVKPALINKAIKVAKNMDWDKHQDEFEDLETLVVTVGKDK